MLLKKISKIIRYYFAAGMITIIPLWITVLFILLNSS